MPAMIPGDQPARARPDTVLFERRMRGLHHPRIVRERQIVVRREVEHLCPIECDPCSLRTIDHARHPEPADRLELLQLGARVVIEAHAALYRSLPSTRTACLPAQNRVNLPRRRVSRGWCVNPPFRTPTRVLLIRDPFIRFLRGF